MVPFFRISMASSALAVAALCLSPIATGTARAAGPSPSLPQEKLHAAYVDGDFDLVERALVEFKDQHKNQPYGRADSIFLARYLGVIYAASPDTREKGRYYMLRLLELDPYSGLVELFVSEEIDKVFEKVKMDHQAKMRAQGKPPTALASSQVEPTPSKRPSPSGSGEPAAGPKRKDSHAGIYWTVGGLGLFAAGAGTYYYLESRKPSEDIVYDVVRKP